MEACRGAEGPEIVYILFAVGQWLRAVLEERFFMEVNENYITYMQNTGMFFPRLFPRRQGGKFT